MTGSGSGGGGGGSEETSAAAKLQSTSASTETVGEVVTVSVSVSASSTTLARGRTPEVELDTWGTAVAVEALMVSASPEEAKTASARLPVAPVTALPRTVSGVEGRQAARCRAPVVGSVNSFSKSPARSAVGFGLEIHPVCLAPQAGLHPEVLAHRRLGPPPLPGVESTTTVRWQGSASACGLPARRGSKSDSTYRKPSDHGSITALPECFIKPSSSSPASTTAGPPRLP